MSSSDGILILLMVKLLPCDLREMVEEVESRYA